MAGKMKKIKQENKPTNEKIAALAHQLFEQEGRPHGRDLDHWLQAEFLLRSQADQKAEQNPRK